MIKIERATQEDYNNIVANAVEKTLAKYPAIDVSENTICCSGWHNDTLLAVAGFQHYWAGTFYCWIVVSKDSISMPIETVRAMRRMLTIIESEFEVTRLQCTVRCDFPKAEELVVHLGFEKEGVMRKYTPDGCDAFLYAKLIGE